MRLLDSQDRVTHQYTYRSELLSLDHIDEHLTATGGIIAMALEMERQT